MSVFFDHPVAAALLMCAVAFTVAGLALVGWPFRGKP